MKAFILLTRFSLLHDSPAHSVTEADPVLSASVLLGQVVQDRPLDEYVLMSHSVQGASPLLDTKPGGQLTEIKITLRLIHLQKHVDGIFLFYYCLSFTDTHYLLQ